MIGAIIQAMQTHAHMLVVLDALKRRICQVLHTLHVHFLLAF